MAITRIHLVLVLAALIGPALLVGCASGPARALHVSAGCAAERAVALTFDDGPNAPYTNHILEILASREATATFFITGEAAERDPATVRRASMLGMAIGAHSQAHRPDYASMPRREFTEDLARAEAAIERATGERPRLFRAPFGRESDAMREALAERGYVSIGWDVDSADWSDRSVERIVANVTSNAHPGAIVLLHDGGLGGGNPDRSPTVEALPQIIDSLRSQGYALVTVRDLVGLDVDDSAGKRVACSDD